MAACAPTRRLHLQSLRKAAAAVLNDGPVSVVLVLHLKLPLITPIIRLGDQRIALYVERSRSALYRQA
jgi:hypothetical protein